MKRFRGGGVGHASTREATDFKFFKQDRDSRDAKRVLEEDDEDYRDGEQTQYESALPTRSRADRDEEEEDYGYNRGEFSDMDDELEEEKAEEDRDYLDDEFGPEDDGGEVDEFMDSFGYGEM